MLQQQVFKRSDLTIKLERINKDRGVISITKYDKIQKLNSFSAYMELELEDINFIVDTLKNSPFIFSKNNN